MNTRAFLLATSMLASTSALAAIDPPAASKEDGRMRTVTYDPNNPVELYTPPGASLRIEFGADEEIVQVITSDQDILSPDPNAPQLPIAKASSGLPVNSGSDAPQLPPSCDPNLCRSVWGNIVYIKPIRALDPQPLFIQTRRPVWGGKFQMVPYTFELSTRPPKAPAPPPPPPPPPAPQPPADPPAKTVSATTAADAAPAPVAPKPPPASAPVPVWGIHFVYPARVKAAQAAAWAYRQHKAEAEERQKETMAQPSSIVPDSHANFRYGYRGSSALKPDAAWDERGTTFLRYNGNRRVPNIYSQLPDGKETLPGTATEPDPSGNTLRIAGTGTKWFIRDGDLAGCVFDLGPDPTGSTAPTIAQGTAP